MIEIELLYLSGCPSWPYAWNALGHVLVEARHDASVRLVNVEDVDEAQRRGFGGSPTLRIEGRELEDYDGPPVMACRRYADNEGRGWPSRRTLARALQEASDGATMHP